MMEDDPRFTTELSAEERATALKLTEMGRAAVTAVHEHEGWDSEIQVLVIIRRGRVGGLHGAGYEDARQIANVVAATLEEIAPEAGLGVIITRPGVN